MGECQIRSSPVCMVMNKLPSHPPVFILTPSQRPTLICIHTTDPITSSYSTIIYDLLLLPHACISITIKYNTQRLLIISYKTRILKGVFN
jgi:hypothetical protein